MAQRLWNLQCIDGFSNEYTGLFCKLHQILVKVSFVTSLWNDSFKILVHHGDASGQKVSKIIGKVGVDFLDEGFIVEKSVAAERNLS